MQFSMQIDQMLRNSLVINASMASMAKRKLPKDLPVVWGTLWLQLGLGAAHLGALILEPDLHDSDA